MHARLLTVALALGASVAVGPARAENRGATQGVVKEVKDGLILISIGSEDGLKVGDTLEVYRTDPHPAYCGQLRLLAVRESESVARITTRTKETVRVNDRVARKLVATKEAVRADDLLREARTRQLVADQAFTQVVEAKLRKARDGYPGERAKAVDLLRATLLQVWDNPEISEGARNDLLGRIAVARREMSE